MLLNAGDIIDADRRNALFRRRLHRIAGDSRQRLGHSIGSQFSFLRLARLFGVIGGDLCLGKVLQHAGRGIGALLLILHHLVEPARKLFIRL